MVEKNYNIQNVVHLNVFKEHNGGATEGWRERKTHVSQDSRAVELSSVSHRALRTTSSSVGLFTEHTVESYPSYLSISHNLLPNQPKYLQGEFCLIMSKLTND